MNKQAKIGALVLFLFCLAFVISPNSSTRNSGILSNSYLLIFTAVPELQIGCDVKMAGISIGEVTDINFTTESQKQSFGQDGHVVVSIVTDYGVKIPEDSYASINKPSQGNVWLEITPGFSSAYLDPESVVRLHSLSDAAAGIQSGLANLRNLRANTDDLRKTINDPKFRTNIRDLASNARFYSSEMKNVSGQASGTIHNLNNLLDEKDRQMALQIERIDVQMLQAVNTLQAIMPKAEESLATWNQRLTQYSQKFASLSTTAINETRRFNDIADKAAKISNGFSDGPTLKKMHKLADKLDGLAAMAEDLHGITSSPEARQSLKDLAVKYRDQSKAIRDKLKSWEKAVGVSDNSSAQEPNSSNSPDVSEPAPSATPVTGALPSEGSLSPSVPTTKEAADAQP